MKCDVCYTTIPLGETRCPNCGMVMKKEVNVKINSDFQDSPTHKKTYTTHKEFSNSKQKNKMSILSLISSLGTVILLIISVMGILDDVSFDITSIFHSSNESGYTSEAYEKYLNNMSLDLIDMGYIVNNSSVDLFSQDDCIITLQARKDNLDYDIDLSFHQSEVVSSYLQIKGSYEGYESESYLYLNEANLNKLCRDLGFENVYSIFKSSHSNLIKDNNRPSYKYYSGYYDDYEIYIVENLSDGRTHFTYTISQ